MMLAEEAIVEFSDSIDWSKYDLDNDGTVDRLMILHTAVGQETGGDSNRIWSHFAMFQKPIDLPNGIKSPHYAMASIGSGLVVLGRPCTKCYTKWELMTCIHLMGNKPLCGKVWEIGTLWLAATGMTMEKHLHYQCHQQRKRLALKIITH